ncbi:MAG: sigma-54-dependent Fis family transcriptional regulator [Ignavibacteriales bacterium]|nr:sigma-54-dependent Fis family transcriptional regulator [Ignavibacteriales bacterium]
MNQRGRIIIIDDEPNILKTLTIGLESIGFEVDGFLNPIKALEHLGDKKYALAFIDLMMQPMDGMTVLKEIRRCCPEVTAVMITAYGTVDSAVEAMKNGAYDFLQKPFDLRELQAFTEKVFEFHQLQQEVRELRSKLADSKSSKILTNNSIMKQQLELATQVADSMLTVLIEGESGTGKELVAQYIHEQSNRRDKPFVKVNCAALAESLLESELFGHAKGAFTGAYKDREGRFEVAQGGTLLLDEVGEIPQPVQVKLLRFLQSREFERVGENITRKVDVRVIAATNRRLVESLQEGNFREDLYYRINAVRISLPSLRERPEDLLVLIYHFIKKFSNESKEVEISADAVKLLVSYRWPGNVRELENVIERATILARDGVINVQQLPEEIQHVDLEKSGLLSLDHIEQQHISRVLKVTKDLDEASRVLNIDPATLWRKRKKYGL